MVIVVVLCVLDGWVVSMWDVDVVGKIQLLLQGYVGWRIAGWP